MFVDKKTKVLVSKSFKTASSSFYDLLNQQSLNGGIIRFDYHRTINQILKEYDLDQEEYNTWTLIRNPWDYVVSAYCWARWNYECPTHYSFEDFIFKYSEFNWKKQIDYWDLEYIDYVIQYENLEEDSKKFCQIYGYSYHPLKKLKSGIRPEKSYQEWHTDKTRDYIYDVFEYVIKVYDYEY